MEVALGDKVVFAKYTGSEIKLDEKNAYAYYYQGLAYYQSGQADKAVAALKMFLQLNPYAPEAGKAKKIVDQLC